MLFIDVWRVVLQCYANNERDLAFAYGGNDNLLQVIRLYIFDDNDEIASSDLQLFRSHATAVDDASSSTRITNSSAQLSHFFSRKSVSRIKYTNEPVDTPHRLAKLIDEYKRYGIMRIALTLRKISVESPSVSWVGESLFRWHAARIYDLRKGRKVVSEINEHESEETTYRHREHDSLSAAINSNRWTVDTTIEENEDDGGWSRRWYGNDDNEVLDEDDDISFNDDHHQRHRFNMSDDNDDDEEYNVNENFVDFEDDDMENDGVGGGGDSLFDNYKFCSGSGRCDYDNDVVVSGGSFCDARSSSGIVFDGANDGVDSGDGGDQFNNFKTVSRAKKIASCPTARLWYIETYKHFFNKIFATCRKIRNEVNLREAFVF
ncbi:hypothetical protein KPH14_013081 [Odynerus spinipes]|uniref:Uncharacterized protein n=1 Tax=Odynerus spinipes TaxID=1348599 RepID=A0AAD9R7Y3_9HYME|nr:hypothetical protein KPH14_013081 [Odynerus spinipes]